MTGDCVSLQRDWGIYCTFDLWDERERGVYVHDRMESIERKSENKLKGHIHVVMIR